MKRLTIGIVLLSLISISVFGLFAMTHGEHSGCIASVSEGIVCPASENNLASLNFHANTFKKLSAAILEFAGLPGILLLVIGLAVFLYTRSSFARVPVAAITPVSFSRTRLAGLYATSYSPLRYWLALHEQRDSA